MIISHLAREDVESLASRVTWMLKASPCASHGFRLRASQEISSDLFSPRSSQKSQTYIFDSETKYVSPRVNLSSDIETEDRDFVRQEMRNRERKREGRR